MTTATLPSREKPLVTLVVEASNWEPEHRIQLDDALQAVHGQTYPHERTEVFVVLDDAARPAHADLLRDHPWLAIAHAPAGASYYEIKDLAASLGTGDLVAFSDADCIPEPGWLEELVSAFATAPADVAVVQGQTRFMSGTFSRALDVSWWSRAFEAEGIIDRLYTANNMCWRREDLRRHPFAAAIGYQGLERPLTRRLHAAGRRIWLNPRARIVHNYTPSLREIVQRGLQRGFNWLAIRRQFPHGPLARLGPLAPPVGMAGMLVNDCRRLLARSDRIGLVGLQRLKIPAYLVAFLCFDLLAGAGMYWALLAPRRGPRRPH